MSSTADIARSPLPDGIEQYAGMWVAIRGGKVVASAETVEDLFEGDNVLTTDVLYRVPERGSYFY